MAVKSLRDQILEDLNKPRGLAVDIGLTSSLHEGQIKALAPLYSEGVGTVFLAAARKFGKTETAIYAAWRFALLNPNSIIYFVGPEKDHLANIYWIPNRIQRFLDNDSDKYIRRIKDRERIVEFKNNSVIQLIGSENWKAGQGLSPDFVIYDEFKAFHPRFHTEMNPNRAAKGAKLLIIGTQPAVGDRNKEEYEGIAAVAKTDESFFYMEATTWDNPINQLPAQKKFIDDHIRELRASGQEDVVQREYYSKIVPGGSRSVFPMFDREKHIKPHASIIKEIWNDRKHLDWFVAADPGTSTVYGVLFGCINPYSKKVYLLDEIYEKDRKKTVTSSIMPRVMDIQRELYPEGDVNDSWFKVMDEAGAWSMAEAEVQFDLIFMPTMKHLNKKDARLSMIKELYTHNLITISDRCVNLAKETEEYAQDSSGKIPKGRDHLLDCKRYLLDIANYDMVEAVKASLEAPIESTIEKGRFRAAGAAMWDDDDDWQGDFW